MGARPDLVSRLETHGSGMRSFAFALAKFAGALFRSARFRGFLTSALPWSSQSVSSVLEWPVEAKDRWSASGALFDRGILPFVLEFVLSWLTARY